MYTYNSFYAGANKKIEALLNEMKNELNEIREEIQSLKGNKTLGKDKLKRRAKFTLIKINFVTKSRGTIAVQFMMLFCKF